MSIRLNPGWRGRAAGPGLRFSAATRLPDDWEFSPAMAESLRRSHLEPVAEPGFTRVRIQPTVPSQKRVRIR